MSQSVAFVGQSPDLGAILVSQSVAFVGQSPDLAIGRSL